MSALDQIKARVADCKSYNFGLRNADKLAHEDAPKLLAALEAVEGRIRDLEDMEAEHSSFFVSANVSAGSVAKAIRKAIDEALR